MAKTKANKNNRAVKVQPTPREAHDHLHNEARVRGNRIRFRCECGAVTKWRQMTPVERTLYKSVVANTLEHLSVGFNPGYKEDNLKLPKRKSGKKVDPEPAPSTSDIKSLLSKVQTDAHAGATDDAMNLARQAGVRTISDIKLDSLSLNVDNSGNPYAGYLGAIETVTEAQANNHEPGPTCTDACGHNLPDRDDDSRLAVSEDFEDEGDLELYEGDIPHVWMLLANGELLVLPSEDAGGYDNVVDQSDAEWAEGDGEWVVPEETLVRLGYRWNDDRWMYERDMCYITLNGETSIRTRSGVHQELEAYLAKRPDGPHEIGEARWSNKTRGWVVPAGVLSTSANSLIPVYEEDETKVADFVAEAYDEKKYVVQIQVRPDGHLNPTATFGPFSYASLIERIKQFTVAELQFAMKVRGLKYTTKTTRVQMATAIVDQQIAEEDIPSPEEQARENNRFSVELDFGNDNHMGVQNGQLADFAGVLQLQKRDDLEFAVRKLGVKGVTTKTTKRDLIRAIVVMADTTLVKEHALNRAAIMVRTNTTSSDDEWDKHYVRPAWHERSKKAVR